MNCQSAREVFPELLDSRTAATAHLDARAHLAGCPECQREFSALSQTLSALDRLPVPQPSPRLRQNFYAMLEEEKHSAASVRAATEREFSRQRVSLWRWVLAPIGVCALLAGGFLAGRQSAPAPTVGPADSVTQRELAELRTKVDRMEAMNQIVAKAFAQQQEPASDRLRGVLTSAAQRNPTDMMIDELIASLALDPSANVRLRALDALYPHSDREVVRAGVLTSLSRESNPLVQVAMIDFLAAARDHDAKSALEKMSVNDTTDLNVREAAKRALAQL
jgi:hypothetical protein